MRKVKSGISIILLVCMIVSLLPPVQIARAAEVTQRYELDTDGIDPGETYLIVNTGTAGSGNALRFNYSSYWSRDFRNQTLQIQTDENGIRYIETGFTNEEDCLFQFSAANAGNISHGTYSVELSDSGFTSGDPDNTLTFTNVGNGAYRIHYTSWRTTYYLRYNNSDWARNTSSSTVYLYKLVDHIEGYDVVYNGNGHTSGTMPEDAIMISAGEQYQVAAPKDLRKDVGEDTWLFQCWNTAADGSGTEYAPEETLVVTEDITLYAQWYQQTKHTVEMITYLDGTPTDVEKISGQDKHFYALLEGTSEYIPLTRKADGTYSNKVAENGTYVIYSKIGDGEYEAVHGHKVVIYNQDGNTECLHYSVRYDVNGGSFAEGEALATAVYHAEEHVTVAENIPTLAGNRFVGWKDQEGNLYTPGQQLSAAIDRTVTLTAQWEETITVTVNLSLQHKPATGGANGKADKHEVVLTFLQYVNDANLPLEEIAFDSDSVSWKYDPETDITTYSYTFTGLPKGHYHATAAKSHYEVTTAHSGEHDGDQTIDITLVYSPTSFDLDFKVVVENDSALSPKAVNLKVVCWGERNGVLGWYTISQQDGVGVPVTVPIVNGEGSGYYSVWQYWPDGDGLTPYVYRVEVTSFVLPDDSVVHASGDLVHYVANGTGFYTATVSIEPGSDQGIGKVPTYPDGTNTTLDGSFHDDSANEQSGIPTVTIRVNPYTVTFDAGEGLVDGQQTVTLQEQFRYPDLNNYVAIPNKEDQRFICWVDENGEPMENQAGQLLPGDVTYYARYNDNITLSGNVVVEAVYEQDGQIVQVYEADRAKKPQVVLQKKIGDVYNDVASAEVILVYEKDAQGNLVGRGEYTFQDLPNDGTEYRIKVLTLNYNSTYDNNADGAFEAEEAVAVIDVLNAEAQIDIHLDFAPDSYQQAVHVDASLIHEDLRPTEVLVQILGRDLGDVHHYQVISQHSVAPYGIRIPFSGATGMGFEELWNWHTNATLYEYQMQVYKVYGNDVEGAYSQEGIEYSDSCPYTVVYGPSNNYLQQTIQSGVMLEAKLVPKEYPVILDLNLGDDPTTPVYGLEEYMVDDGTGVERYQYMHTWSFADKFVAYPYREGYVFTGWENSDTDDVHIDDGVIHVGNTLSNAVTLTATWEKLSGTDYTIRHLELNTDKVLHGAQAVSGAAQGDTVVAADKALTIKGYVYAGAMVDGNYIDKADNPVMTVSNDPLKNLMVIYYLPDGSDGYTEQVESNLDINKTVVLEDNGTYTITLDTHTKDNPITTLIQQNTPLDIVLVLDQSGSLAENDFAYLTALQDAVEGFVTSVADHGRHNEVDHRIAMVGYAGNATDPHSSDPVKATGGKETDSWINTGVFDSNGEFYLYNVQGFNYTLLEDTGTMTADGIYYTKVTVDGKDKYLLLTHHDEYRHLITEEQARVEFLQGKSVFGYVYNEQGVGSFVELTRNTSGLWLYGDRQLYSAKEFFTYHTDVWTHRDGINPREIHAYGVGADYRPTDGHEGVYTREETSESAYEQSIYQDALVPVSIGAAGSGGTNPGLLKATQSLGADGATRASYGMEMANKILEATPVDASEGRVRLVVMFTDGEPGYMGFDSSSGDQYYQQAVTEANNAIAQAYITKNDHDAYVYTIGLYKSSGVDATSEVAYYMNALSSNYPDAKSMDDIQTSTSYTQAPDGTVLENNGKLFVQYNNTYYPITYGYVRTSGSYNYRYCWYFKRGNTNYSISTATNPVVSGGRVGNYTIYQQSGGYAETPYSGYYATTESADHLNEYFEDVLRDITTKITTEIILHEDTILRDIMGQGLVLTPGSVITAYKQPGTFDLETETIQWSEEMTQVAQVTIPENPADTVYSPETTTVQYKQEDGTFYTKENVPYLSVYNLTAENATNPDEADYHPHTVDITGYDFENWYVSKEHPEGHKMVVTITRVEARDDVQWGRSVATNNEKSGLWLPADENGNRELLLPFEQPTTIFVERAYVLDYGKEFTLSGWYFDDEDGKNATPVHIDCNIENGMNWFDESNPNVSNQIDGEYGNTEYGNVRLADEKVIYSPTSMNWQSFDQFYVFGDTWRKTVLAQDANENGNLWNKVTVIPANNIYYEDSFITTEDTTQNGIDGFVFTGAWSVEGTDSNNTEVPEHLESAPYGDVHGWTDSLGDDFAFTDGSAHVTGLNGEMGAQAEFTFTGTGVEVYTRTNAQSGMVVAMLSSVTTDQNGQETTKLYKSIAMDNLAVSGDYYHIPTVAFKALPYGTYKLQLIATSASTATAEKRYVYYIDGVRIHNPLGSTTNYQADIVKDAYGLETNAVFTEVRDILLDYKDFNTQLPDSGDGKMGAVFIDWIQPGQESGNDQAGTGVPTYEIGTFEAYGPKNEVYLSAGQAIVLKVEKGNTYYVGLKSLTGAEVTANVSGIDQAEPTAITLAHTTDMYYQVTPVDGYIVIQNGSEGEQILSITNLRTTNLTAPVANGGVLPVSQQEAVLTMRGFSKYMLENRDEEEQIPQPSDPEEEEVPSAQQQAQANLQLANALFASVRRWLETE